MDVSIGSAEGPNSGFSDPIGGADDPLRASIKSSDRRRRCLEKLLDPYVLGNQ